MRHFLHKGARMSQTELVTLLVTALDEGANITITKDGNNLEIAATDTDTTDHSALSNKDNADEHPIGSITGLQAAIDAKANTGHGHAIGDVTNLQTTIDDHDTRITSAQSAADTAQGAADTADLNAGNAQTTADAAQADATQALADASAAQTTADAAIPQSDAGIAGGVATLDSDKEVPEGMIPLGHPVGSYHSGDTWLDLDTSTQYQWDGVKYVKQPGGATVTVKTKAQWVSDNTVIATGEYGKESDTGRVKLGDGSTAWNALDYFTRLLEWKDNLYPIIKTQGPSALTWTDIGNGIYANAFSLNDTIQATFHINHDYALGTEVYPHVHFICSAAMAPGDTIEWTLKYVKARGHMQEESLTDATTAIVLAHTVPDRGAGKGYELGEHIILEVPELDAFDVLEPDTLVLMSMQLSGHVGEGTIFGLMIDLHYLSDREGTIHKRPNFLI